MDIKEIMSGVKSYYGDFTNQEVEKQVAAFIINRIKEDEYKSLLRIIKDWHKAYLGSPCIATIRECIEKARKVDEKFVPYKTKGTDTTRWSYKDQYDNGDEELKPVGSILEEFNNKIKKV